jgi:HlyD family secretion protein
MSTGPGLPNAAWPLLAVLLLASCAESRQDFAVGTLERDRLELVADNAEPIVAVLVAEGDEVAANALLLRQDTARLDARLARARAERDQALARLEEAEHGPRAQDIAQARARLAAAESNVGTARRELERERELIAQGFASRNRVDQLQGVYDGALAAREEARAALDELLEGSRSEVIDQARHAARAAAATVTELEVSVERAAVHAPLSGTVEVLPFEVGERPQPGQMVAALLTGAYYARVHVPQPLRTGLQVGDPAAVRIDGHAQDYRGTLRWIAHEAAFTPYYALTQHDRSRLSYLAEVVLETSAPLPVGVPVEVRFPAAHGASQ